MAALAARELSAREARARTLAQNQARHRHLPAIAADEFCDYLQPWVLVAMNTGCRRGELQKLQWSDVDFSGDRITVRAATAKASKTRHISLNRIAREALAQWSKQNPRSEEHTSELQSLMRISYAVFCLKNKTNNKKQAHN